MIYNLSAHHNIHYFQAAVYASCYTGADDTVGLEGTDQFYSTGSSVHFTYSAFHQAENPSNEYPRPNSGYSTNSYLLQSSLAFRKASFVKIRDITLGYTLPKEWTSKMMVQKLRIYCSLNNFITFTDFPNYDPESNGSMDFPLAKQVLFGINLSL
jgi:hypothetical protein